MPEYTSTLLSASSTAKLHSHSGVAVSDRSLNNIVSEALLPQIEYFCGKLLSEKKSLVIDGTASFNGRDKFLPGKIATGMSYLLLNTAQTDPRFPRYLAGFRAVADMTIDEDNDSWGIYYYVTALNKLREADVLDQAISEETLDKLRHKLDWRRFVTTPAFTLVDLPTNYYGVAFSIARLRYLLGWEDVTASEVLLDCMIKHYQAYSGEFGFSDETDGEGRFDRYSILLIGEICQRFIETGMEVTPQLRQWLRKAVDVVLVRLNLRGDGFDFGRSIGAYGDSAFLEVLSAAAVLGVLSAQECDMAYAFSVRASLKYANFWYDAETHSVNLWDKGRRTDAYRGKHRILGENLSLLHQHIYTNNLWNRIGYRDKLPSPGFDAWLKALPRFTLTWFARGEHERALLTFRDAGHVISLPLVNGGITQHMHNPYFPIPFANDIVQGAADTQFPQLLPRFTLDDGAQLTASAFIQHIETLQNGSSLTLRYEQAEMNRLGAHVPVRDGRLRVETRYTFDSGVISRIDCYTPAASLHNVEIDMEFASFSGQPTLNHEAETFRISFAQGAVYEFDISGFDEVKLDAVTDDAQYRAPMGQMQTRIRCRRRIERIDTPLTLTWTLRYRQG